jgi:hypothetical protein
MLVELLGVMIPIIALMIPIVAIWTKHRQRVAELQINAAGPAAEMAREIDDLRARIAVLERIVTDERRSKTIADEIEALRAS